MYDDYDFNQEDDFQRLVEGRCSDDEEFFKEHSKRSQKLSSKSGQADKSSKHSTSKSTSKQQTNKRKRDLELDDEDSNSAVDLRDDRYDKWDKFDKYSKYDRYERSEDEDDYGENDPVNPADEAEEEPEKKAKSQKEGDGEEKPKRKNVVRNPRVMLNEDKLKSSDGVIKLPTLFKEMRFKGKHHEKEDLNAIIGVYQNWAHRLMPSLQFDDFVERAEMLCRKAKMKVFLNKIRNGMPLDVRDQPGEQRDNEEVVQQYDSQDEGLMGDKPDLVPKAMDDEFMDDDFDWGDNDAMNGLGEPTKGDTPIESTTNGAEDVRMLNDSAPNGLKEHQESQPPIDGQVLNTVAQDESSRPTENNVQTDSPAKIGEKMEIADNVELVDQVDGPEKTESSNKEESLDKVESSSKESPDETTGAIVAVASQSDQPIIEVINESVEDFKPIVESTESSDEASKSIAQSIEPSIETKPIETKPIVEAPQPIVETAEPIIETKLTVEQEATDEAKASQETE